MVDYGFDKWQRENARKSPCYGCEERYPKCHSECERYFAYADERSKELHTTRKANYCATTRKWDSKMKNRRFT